MPKKKKKKKFINNNTEIKTILDEDKYSKIFSNPEELVKVLKKIDQWEPNEPLITFINNRRENLIFRIICAPKELKLASYISRLAEKKMDLNLLNNNLSPPIFLAIRLKHKEAIKSLYDGGANFKFQNIDGLNILDMALITGSHEIYRLISVLLNLKEITTLKAGNFLTELAESDNKKALSQIEYLQNLAQQWGLIIDIDAKHPVSQRTALMAATRAKKLDVVNYLIENKANLSIEDREGVNALSDAICTGDDDVLNAILASADARLINKISTKNISPLQLSVEKNPKFINLLLEKKADINAENKEGVTVLHTAIYFNNLAIIELIIDRLSLNILNLKCSQRFTYLSLAIEHSDVAVLEKLFQAPGLTPDSFSSREIEILYGLAIELKKELHFKFMIEKRLNFDSSLNHPLYICFKYENIRLIKWFFNNQARQDVQSALCNFHSLIDVIRYSEKNFVVSLFDLIINFFGTKVWESKYATWSALFAFLCLEKDWLGLTRRLQPALKFFLGSDLLREFSKYDLLRTINYLQGSRQGHKYILPNGVVLEGTFDTFKLESPLTDLSSILNRVPGMIDYIPDSKNPNQWVQFFYFSQPLTNLTYTPSTIDSRTKTLTPFSFFKAQGLSNIEIQKILQEKKEHKAMPILSLLDSKQTKKDIPLPCTWFSGQVSSSHLDHLQSMEGINILNTFLLVPDSLKNMMSSSLPRRFHLQNGLKPLHGKKSVKVILKFIGNENVIEYKTKFTHEITHPGTENRILCITVEPDGLEQRGILILAVHYLPGGLHNHRTPLPTVVHVDITNTASTNQTGFNI